MIKLLSVPLAIMLAILTAISVAVAIVVTALLSPMLDLFANYQPSKFYDYGKDHGKQSNF